MLARVLIPLTEVGFGPLFLSFRVVLREVK